MAESDRQDRRSAVERRIVRSLQDERRQGALSEASLQRERSAEGYLRANAMPRYMERAQEIHVATQAHRRRMAIAYAELRERLAGDPAAFAELWRARVRGWDFAEVNDLIRLHNEWYPVERQLPWDSRTGDYVLIAGRSYRRDELDEAWALAQFPADPEEP